MMRPLVLLVLLAAGALAEGETQIDWTGDWEEAFRLASERKMPVMVCINSKDGEPASDRAAKETYKDPEFVALSRKFVMLVVSVHMHWPKDACPRFGQVTCEQHMHLYRELSTRYGDQFVAPGGRGEMISPQHAWFLADGTLLRRKEYELSRAELMERMRKVLEEVAAPAGGADPAARPGDADAPLTDSERAELERAVKSDREGRRAALGNLLSTGKKAAQEAVLELAAKGDEKLRCDVLRALGKARALNARPFVEDYLKDRVAEVRSFAAVALEDMGQKESAEPLLRRIKTEGDTFARKNMYRALGVCGGGAADKEGAKTLLKGLGDKQVVAAKHAALALRSYAGPAAELVLKPLEQAAVREKSPELRGAIVYTLAFIGNKETTIPALQKVLETSTTEIARAFVRNAIATLRGDGGGGGFGESARWIFREDRDDPARQ